MLRTLVSFLTVSSVIGVMAAPLNAEQNSELNAWKDLRQLVFKDKDIAASKGRISVKAPYRAADDRRVPISFSAKLEPGRSIKTVTVIIDENPMPVSATLNMRKPRNTFEFSTFMRFNGPSPLRVVLEADDGKLYMSETYVKTSGLGACASPPVGDPKELLANLGAMQLLDKPMKEEGRMASQMRRDAHLKIKHPNLTGLQMDQITLQYILARFVKTVEVSQGGEDLFSLQGGISISENPELTFDYMSNGAGEMTIKVTDTENTKFEKTFPLNIGS